MSPRSMAVVTAAVRRLDRALELAPQDPVVLAARATTELRRGRYQAALDFFERRANVAFDKEFVRCLSSLMQPN